MKNFENMTIGELRKLYDQFREQNPEFKTALELLEENERRENENRERNKETY